MSGYINTLEEITEQNESFRKVLYTGSYCQLVVMSLKPGEDIGTEVHHTVDQFFRVEDGEGTVIMDGEETSFRNGHGIIVPAGTEHNIINTSKDKTLKLYTLYAPPNHPDKTEHKTKDEADEYERTHHE